MHEAELQPQHTHFHSNSKQNSPWLGDPTPAKKGEKPRKQEINRHKSKPSKIGDEGTSHGLSTTPYASVYASSMSYS